MIASSEDDEDFVEINAPAILCPATWETTYASLILAGFAVQRYSDERDEL